MSKIVYHRFRNSNNYHRIKSLSPVVIIYMSASVYLSIMTLPLYAYGILSFAWPKGFWWFTKATQVRVPCSRRVIYGSIALDEKRRFIYHTVGTSHTYLNYDQLKSYNSADNANVAFWLTLQSYNYFATAPVLVFFLTLDRCLALKVQLLYGIWIQKFTAFSAAFVAFLIYCVSVGSFTIFKLIECKGWYECDILRYSAKPMQPQLVGRLIFSTANFVLCLYFLWLIRTSFHKKSVKNSVVKFALVTELCCSVIPTYFGYVFLTITGESAIKYLGIYSNTLASVDAAVCGVYFLRTLSKRGIVVQSIS